jgi:hypothetical protein
LDPTNGDLMPLPRISFASALISAVAACSCAYGKAAVSGEGFGALRFGMTIAEGEQALGAELKPGNPDDVDDDACRYYYPVKAFPGLSFMTVDGVIARLDVYDSREIATNMGAKIGDNETRVLDLYKDRVKVEPHFYSGLPDHYIKVLGAKGQTQIVFETKNGIIDNYRAGRLPEVEYVEGCS